MTVLELCDRAALDEEARDLARPEMPVRAYLEQLAAGGRAVALVLSGGIIALPATQAATGTEPHLCARMVAGAMAMAAVLDPPHAAEHFRSFLDRGFHLASELKIWEEK